VINGASLPLQGPTGIWHIFKNDALLLCCSMKLFDGLEIRELVKKYRFEEISSVTEFIYYSFLCLYLIAG
jgi:hypothetical protein